MTPDLELHYHHILAGVIEDVLRCQTGPIRVPGLATAAGFSRFHLARLFRQTTEETLEQFLRRIRLERAAYMLLHSDQSILEISIDSGYTSPEAFSRAFRSSYGSLPSVFRKHGEVWKLAAPTDLHWNADWIHPETAPQYDEQVVEMPARYACVWRCLGNYSKLEHSWQRLETAFPDARRLDRTFVTIYLDNMWTHPVTWTMRADIGWLCEPGEMPPRGMRRIVIPRGLYASTRFVERTERNNAWSAMCGKYASGIRNRPELLTYDEYGEWPLPFEQVTTRILVGISAR
jgi:AraC family transcriptional regulator